MTILVSGGGTGGHVTPILAVAHELKKQQPDCKIVYVGERGGKFQTLASENSAIDEVYMVLAGKFRRYHGDSWLARLFDIKTLALNIRDAFYVLLGTIQALRIVRQVNPSVVFLKGGYVGVPVGIAGAMQKKPLVTHDSDAVPGLANRIIGHWVTLHATGLPTEFYSYPKQKARYVGVLVSENYYPVDESKQKSFRRDIDIPETARLLLVTGGSLGARRLNSAFAAIAADLLKQFPDLHIVHQVGKGNLDQTSLLMHERYHSLEFMEGMHRYTGAADVVVTRAGANTLAELGVQGKACVVVPNPQLTCGHQLKNADYLLQHRAIMVVDEKTFPNDTTKLKTSIERLIEYPMMRLELAQTLQGITKQTAAKELAMLLVDIGKQGS